MSTTVSAAASTRGKSSGEPETPSARHALPFQPRQLYGEPTQQKKKKKKKKTYLSCKCNCD